MEGLPVMTKVPLWLCNELKHVEEGRIDGGGFPGKRRELPPVYADLLFHGVLTPRPWGGTVLPSTFVLGKGSDKNGGRCEKRPSRKMYKS